MPNTTSRGTHSASRWWALLLLLPAALLGGWIVGRLPVPATPAAVAAERSQWTSFDAAIAESNRSGKPVLIDFNAEWCGPCRRMKEEVFDNGSLGGAIQAEVIPVSITDRVHEDGRNSREVEELMQRYRVDAFPTLVVFSPKSGRTVTTRGYGGADRTAAWIADAAKQVR